MKVGTKSTATKFTVPSPEYELSKTDSTFQLVLVGSFRISMTTYTVPTGQLGRTLKQKSNNPATEE